MSTLSITAAITDSTISLTRRTNNLAVTTAAGNADLRVISVGTSEEEHTISTDIGNAGYVYVKNLDETNYVDFGFATGVYPMRLKAEQVALFPITPAQASFFLIANTAACRVEIMVHEA